MLQAYNMSASGLHFIGLLWLLLVFQVELQTAISQRHCNNLKASFPSCNNNPVLRVTKSTEMYQVTLLATDWQCYGDICLLNNVQQRNFTCNDTCRVCQQLQGKHGIPFSDISYLHVYALICNTISIHAGCETNATTVKSG